MGINKYSQAKISTKLMVGVLLISALVTGMGVFSLVMFKSLEAKSIEMGTETAPLADACMELKLSTTMANLQLEQVLYGSQDREQISRVRDLLNESIWYADAILSGGTNDIGVFYASKDPEVLELTARIRDNLTEFITISNQRYDATFVRKLSALELQALDDAFDSRYETIVKDIDVAETMIHDDMDTIRTEAHETATFGNYSIVMSTIGVIILSMLIGWFNSKNINSTLTTITTTLSEVSGSVHSASVELSDASTRIAQGSTEQASSITQTSANMEQTTAMVKQTTVNTREASVLSEQTSNYAIEGYAKMTEMNQSMNQIKKSSEDITKIIKVIDEIAFQTNILALNAAVEAARAGSSGKGFAVVAEEVRNLAQRSAVAAKNTAEIIDKNIELSKQGVALSTAVSGSLEAIKENAHKVSSLVADIARASEEQSTGTEQISSAISQMEAVTQQNAAVAEQSSAASEELQAQAEELTALVDELSRFVRGAQAMTSMQAQPRKISLTGSGKRNYASKSFDRKAGHLTILPLEKDGSYK